MRSDHRSITLLLTIALTVGAIAAGQLSSTAATSLVDTDGDLDPTFNPGGTGTGPAIQDVVHAIAVTTESKIIVGGNFLTYNDNPNAPDHIMRLTGNGALDTTFNASGTGAGGPGVNSVYAVAVQADGKIVIGGAFTSYNGNQFAPDAIMRLNADGTQEAEFNDDGTGSNGAVTAIAMQADGKILFSGATTYNGNSAANDHITRLQPNGTLDTAFNIGGTGVGNNPSSGGPAVNAIAVQPDGKILIGGNFDRYNGDLAAPDRIMRLNSNGTLDTTFNPGGTGSPGQVRAIAIQPDGKILIGGDFDRYNGDVAAPDRIMRLNADGTPDTGFNFGAAGANSAVYAVTLQADGKILVGGQPTSYNGDSEASDRIMRLNTDGTRDTTFNLGGAGSNGTVFAVALQPGPKIIIGGMFSSYDGSDAAPDGVLRLHSSNAVATPTPTPVADLAAVSGRVIDPDGRGIKSATVSIIDSEDFQRAVPTNSLGYFVFENIPTGISYEIRVNSKRFRFLSQPIRVDGDREDIVFVGIE